MIVELLFLFFLLLAVFIVVKVGFAILKYLVTNAVIGLVILWFTTGWAFRTFSSHHLTFSS